MTIKPVKERKPDPPPCIVERIESWMFRIVLVCFLVTAFTGQWQLACPLASFGYASLAFARIYDAIS